MTAQIIQLRDYQNPKDLERLYSEGIEIVNIALMGDAGLFVDTAPCEMNMDEPA